MEFEEQAPKAGEHAALVRGATVTFGFLTPVVHHHAQIYGVVLEAPHGNGRAAEAPEPIPGRWICKACSMIDEPAVGDPKSGIAAGSPFEAIPDTWTCPIRGTRKANFIPYREPELQTA